MRFGRNPFRFAAFEATSQELTIATTVHIPFQAGYWKQSLDVFKLMLASLQAHTDVPYDFMVVDNRSCAEVREYLLQLHQDGIIQVLVLSEDNLGPRGGVELILGAARGKYVAYSDCDIFFDPGWFAQHKQVLEAYPNAGMVSGVPLRHRNHDATARTLEWARATAGVQLEEGLLADPAWIADYCEGFGWRLDENDNVDHKVTFNGVSAFVGACHFQFVMPSSVALNVLPLPRLHPHAMREFDEHVEACGYLRLSTDGAYIHHMGNALTPRWEAEARRLGVPLQPGGSQRLRPTPRWRYRAVHNRFVRPIALGLYDKLFELLTRKST